MGKISQDFYKKTLNKYLFKVRKRITKYHNSLDKNLLKMLTTFHLTGIYFN